MEEKIIRSAILAHGSNKSFHLTKVFIYPWRN